jgi:hypothetical protein
MPQQPGRGCGLQTLTLRTGCCSRPPHCSLCSVHICRATKERCWARSELHDWAETGDVESLRAKLIKEKKPDVDFDPVRSTGLTPVRASPLVGFGEVSVALCALG